MWTSFQSSVFVAVNQIRNLKQVTVTPIVSYYKNALVHWRPGGLDETLPAWCKWHREAFWRRETINCWQVSITPDRNKLKNRCYLEIHDGLVPREESPFSTESPINTSQQLRDIEAVLCQSKDRWEFKGSLSLKKSNSPSQSALLSAVLSSQMCLRFSSAYFQLVSTSFCRLNSELQTRNFCLSLAGQCGDVSSPRTDKTIPTALLPEPSAPVPHSVNSSSLSPHLPPPLFSHISRPSEGQRAGGGRGNAAAPSPLCDWNRVSSSWYVAGTRKTF